MPIAHTTIDVGYGAAMNDTAIGVMEAPERLGLPRCGTGVMLERYAPPIFCALWTCPCFPKAT